MATTNKNMTYAQAFSIAVEVLDASTHPEKAEAIAKIQKQMEILENKKSAPSKAQAAKATANAGLGETVLDFLRADPARMFTVTELLKEVPGLPAEITNQKLTYILRMDSVKPFVRKEMVKGKAFYKYAEPAEVED